MSVVFSVLRSLRVYDTFRLIEIKVLSIFLLIATSLLQDYILHVAHVTTTILLSCLEFKASVGFL